MPGESSTSAVALVLKLGFASPAEFIEKYGALVTRGGLYLRLKEPKPPGTRIRFELRLATGQPVLAGAGVVDFVTGHAGSGGVPGMGIRFSELAPESHTLLEALVAKRPQAASADPPLPAGVGPALKATSASPSHGPAAAPAPQPTAAASPQGPRPLAPSGAPAVLPPSKGPVPIKVVATPLDRVKPLAPGEKPKGPIIGIDLGTTNSCAATVQKGKPFVIPSREGYNTVPSIIALNSRGKVVVGHPAKGQMLTNPRLTVYGAKRLVGRPYHSPIVQHIRDRFHYEIVEGVRGEAAVRLGERIYSLQELSAMILVEVREIAQNYLGEEVRRAIITVPAYYNDNQRQAVREAGALAGLYVERILNEPTAAALAFGYGRDLHKSVLIYDLGGGTFDASLMKLSGSVYEVLSTGGDTFLGGVDFDNRIVDYLLARFQAETKNVFQGDRVAMQRITDAAERAKCALSERAEMKIQVPFVTMLGGRPYDLDVVLTRGQLEELTQGLVDRTLKTCEQVLGDKGVTAKEVDEVLLVGGQSRAPLVQDRITRFFGKSPYKGVHPDEAVALGAALLAHSLSQIEGVVLIDVLPMAIGVGLPGGRFKRIVERNTPLPHEKSYAIATSRDDQTEIELTIFQGDAERVQENEYLGTLKLDGLPRGPKGVARAAVTFALTAECLLTVTAQEASSGRQVTATMSTRDTPATVRAKLGIPAPGGGPTPEAGAATPPPPPAAVAGVGEAAAAPKGGLFGRLGKLFRKSNGEAGAKGT